MPIEPGDRVRYTPMPTDPRRVKKRKPRQEISCCLKWLVFFINFPAFLVGVAILALGVYLIVKDYTDIKIWEIILNPATFLAVVGFLTCTISMIGSLGALRDNIFLLKSFAVSVFGCYILIVIVALFVFLLFFADTSEGLSARTILLLGVKYYHSNRNLAELVDALQDNLQCCGVSSLAQGYRDWNLSHQFNCSVSNPQPEKCGVPYSCCKKSVITEAAGSSNPLLPAMRSLECWQNALNRRPMELEHDIYTRGCLTPLRTVFESHSIHLGCAIALIIVPVSILVCLTNVLAKQIDYQHYLLEREAVRHERRQKRKQSRHRARDMVLIENLEEGNLAAYEQSETLPKLPNHPPPPCPPVLDNPKKHSRGHNHQSRSSSSNNKTEQTGASPGNSSSGSAQKKISTPSRNALAGQPFPPQIPSSKDARIKQWILQQSDLAPANAVPTAPPLS